MYARIGARKLFLLLLMTTVVNADWIKEATLTCKFISPEDNITVRCAVLFASFDDASCEQGFIINVINAHFGYHDSNRNANESCSMQPNDCLLSVPLHSISYYNNILVGCNNKTRCDSNLKAEELDGDASCDGFIENDYVLIQFYCLPSEVKKTVSVCIKDYSQGATCITCTENRVIQIVGATLGFQPDTDDWCSVGFDKCRIQPDLDHLEDIRFNCQRQNMCQFNATTSIDRVEHACNSLEYTFETVIYYCSENSGALVTGIGECWPTSAAPSTDPVTSVAVSTTSNSTNTSAAPSTVPVTSVAVSSSSKHTTASTTPSTITATSVAVSTTSKSTTTSTTPSTVPVTSATRSSSSLPASSTTGGATIASDASTYTVVDSLGNVSTTVTEPTSSTDDTTSIIVGCVVGGVVLIILLLLLIFIVWRRRNSENTSKRRGNGSVNGCLSDNTGMPTHSIGNISELAQDQLHPPVYWQEQSITANVLTQEQLADYYSEIEDLHVAQEPCLSLFSIEGFDKEIDKSNAGVYVNVTEPSNAVYSLVQKTNSSTHQKGEDPIASEFLPVGKSEFDNKVRIDKGEEKVSALTRHQSVQRPDQDLVLRENSLYGATETHSPNDAVDKSELAKVRIDKEEEKVSALTRHQSVQRPPEDDLVLRENSLYGATEIQSPNDAVDELTLTENDLYG